VAGGIPDVLVAVSGHQSGGADSGNADRLRPGGFIVVSSRRIRWRAFDIDVAQPFATASQGRESAADAPPERYAPQFALAPFSCCKVRGS
jgi:hypothetical protein